MGPSTKKIAAQFFLGKYLQKWGGDFVTTNFALSTK